MLYNDKLPFAGGPTTLETEYFAYNAVGHTVALTDDLGAAKQRSLYEAFGETVIKDGTSANNRLANTKERDASIGLDNHGFRFYDPDSGRYVTRDPIGYADGLNVYASVKNNPINSIDPLGLWEWPWSPKASWRPAGTTAVINNVSNVVREPGAFASGAWDSVTELGSDIAALPGATKDAITDVVKTGVVHVANTAGWMSDESAAAESPLAQYLSSHDASGTTPVVSEASALGNGLASGDPAAFRAMGIALVSLKAPNLGRARMPSPMLSGKPAGLRDATSAAAGEGLAANSLPEGSFSIQNWAGYPGGLPKPEGTLRLLKGAEYKSARTAANKENTALRKIHNLAGLDIEIHEIKPVKVGGSPVDITNKSLLSSGEHSAFTTWWNKVFEDAKSGPTKKE